MNEVILVKLLPENGVRTSTASTVCEIRVVNLFITVSGILSIRGKLCEWAASTIDREVRIVVNLYAV
jgi:hypothetical protein